MGDFYMEQLVKRKTPVTSNILKAVLIFLTAFSVCITFMMPLVFPLIVVMGVIDFLVFRGMDVEYEYLYVNGTLDVDKIMSKSRRKHLFDMAMNELEILAPAGSPELRQYQSIKPVNYSSREPGAKLYEMIVLKDGGKKRVVFEPGGELLEGMKMMAPRKVLL